MKGRKDELRNMPHDRITWFAAENPDGNGMPGAMLMTFKFLGIWPFRQRISGDRGCTVVVRTEFSRFWYSVASILLLTTVTHTLWAPTMLIRLESSIVMAFARTRNISWNSTAASDFQTFASKQTTVVKVLHPLLICVTSLTARGLAVFTLPMKIPPLTKSLSRIDRVLSSPLGVRSKNAALLLFLYIGFLALNIPLMAYHLWQLSFFHSVWGNAWEAFSIFNIFSTFAMELQFMTFCHLAESRLVYINEKLGDFIAEEFAADETRNSANMFCHPPRADVESVSELFRRSIKVDRKRGAVWHWNRELGSRWQSHERQPTFSCLRRAHIILHDVMEQINGIYQLQLLISIFSSISKILFNLYFSIFGFITSSKRLPTKFQRGQMYIVCSWTVYYCLRFLLIVTFAHVAVKEYKKTKRILVKVDDRTFEDAEKEEKKMFWEHVSTCDFEFSACGLFSLNTALITSTFSSGITYLVIMAQLH